MIDVSILDFFKFPHVVTIIFFCCSVVALSLAKMDELQLFRGDTVLLKVPKFCCVFLLYVDSTVSTLPRLEFFCPKKCEVLGIVCFNFF
jgi:hypothetical protein